MEDIILDNTSYPLKQIMEDILNGKSKIGFKQEIYPLKVGDTIKIEIVKSGDF